MYVQLWAKRKCTLGQLLILFIFYHIIISYSLSIMSFYCLRCCISISTWGNVFRLAHLIHTLPFATMAHMWIMNHPSRLLSHTPLHWALSMAELGTNLMLQHDKNKLTSKYMYLFNFMSKNLINLGHLFCNKSQNLLKIIFFTGYAALKTTVFTIFVISFWLRMQIPEQYN